MKNWLRITLMAAGLGLAAFTAGCGLAPKADEVELLDLIEPPKISQKPEYVVARSTIEVKVSATGKLWPERQQHLYFLEDNAKIAHIYVQPGDPVRKGDIIAEIDTGNLAVQIRKKEIEMRQLELEMKQKLRDSEGRSDIQRELDELNFEIARTELQEMQERLERSRLVAPFDGTLVSFDKKVGDVVKAYEEIGTVADLSRLTVAAKFSSSDLEQIVVGMEAEVNINLAGTHRGRVSRLPISAGSADETSLDAYVLVELDEMPEGLQAGTPLQIDVITERKEDAVLIPPVALRTATNRTYVQVVDEAGNKREVDVEVGLSTATEVEILKGLEPGMKVVGR